MKSLTPETVERRQFVGCPDEKLKQGTTPSSYGQILKASSLLGGTQVLVYAVGLIKTKAAAVFLGPSGVGLVGLYMSATSMIAAVAGMGLTTSGAREIAEASGRQDELKVAQTVVILQRLCWLAGLAGWAITAMVAWPLSIWTFGSSDFAHDIMLLGATVLLGSVAGGQATLLRGVRRIGDLAQINLLCVVANAVIAIVLYSWLGVGGIVPSLILAALAAIGIHWWYVRRVTIQRCSIPWASTFQLAVPMLRLGLAFMWSASLVVLVGFVTRALVVRELGIDQNGLYQAAWAISGMFCGFVLGAMGVDFYPRLAQVASDNVALKRLVNEQTEVGLLLATPGILATLVLAPFLIHLLYTGAFVPAIDLLPWFLAGVLLQFASWPLGYTLLAKSDSFYYALVETIVNVASLGILFVCLQRFGLIGAAVAFTATQCVHISTYFITVRKRAAFDWEPHVVRLMMICACFMATCLVVHYCLTGWLKLGLGGGIVAAASAFSLKRLLAMVALPDRVGRLVQRVPFASYFAVRAHKTGERLP